jgi:hypothetical protein
VTIHYHGTPITPQSALYTLAGRHFCVSYAKPQDVKICHEIGQSVMLDNGAFTFWRTGKAIDWTGYASWVEEWLDYPTTWAVIPDVIEGDEADNDLLIAKWPRSLFPQSAPVWHMHESIARLVRLCQAWPKVCIGSSAEYADLKSSAWRFRIEAAFNAVAPTGVVPWLHMLRGMAKAGDYPFASVDSSDVGQNHHRPQNDPARMAARWDAIQGPRRWVPREQLRLSYPMATVAPPRADYPRGNGTAAPDKPVANPEARAVTGIRKDKPSDGPDKNKAVCVPPGDVITRAGATQARQQRLRDHALCL